MEEENSKGSQQFPKVLITDSAHPILQNGLEKLGYKCIYQPNITLKVVHDQIHHYDGIIINSKIIVDENLICKARKLKFIARLGSGMEIIDQDSTRKHGIAVFNSPTGNNNAVAEHILGMLFALANQINWADAEVRQMIWERERNRGFEIMGKTVGIIGFGHTGSAFAQKLQGLGVNVLAYDKYKENYATAYPYVEESSMATLFEKADIISIHLPYNAETHYLVDTEFLNKFSKPIVLINSSRGKIARTASLIEALEKEKLMGLCADVFENEKPHNYTKKEQILYQRLYEFKNTVFTPHVAGWTHESKRKLAAILLNKITERLH